MKKKKILIADNGKQKFVRSGFYNYNFSYENGNFERWGKTKEDDPQIAPFPEILDCEITTKCNGVGGKLCSFCYKGNTPKGHNMSFETFKNIIDKMKPRNEIEVQLNNGDIKFFKLNDIVKTINGKKLAHQLTENDELIL